MNDLDRLKYLARVRDLRAKLASGELSKRRRNQNRADIALNLVQQRRAEHEKRVRREFAWNESFRAEETHHFMTYVAGARLQVKEDISLIRRAELARDRARETADDARADFRLALSKYQTLSARWRRDQRVLRHKELESEDEMIAAEQLGRWRAGE